MNVCLGAPQEKPHLLVTPALFPDNGMNSAPPVSVLSLLHGGCAIYPDSQTGWFMAFIICCGTNDHTHKGDCFQRTLAQGGVWWFDLNGRDAVTVAYLSKMAEILTVSHSEASFEKHLLFNATFTPKGKLRLNTFILFLRLKTHSAILLYNQAHNLSVHCFIFIGSRGSSSASGAHGQVLTLVRATPRHTGQTRN